MDTVEKLCDDIAMINKSEVVLSGNKIAIKQSFSSDEYNIQFNGNLEPSGNFEIISQQQNVATIKIVGSKQNTIQVLNAQLELISFMPKIASMEDIFIKMVSKV
jgi:ABC-2 type transport system ATP-binding protein